MPDASNIIRKKAGERLLVGMSFLNWLNGETISSVTSVDSEACTDGSASDIVIETITIVGTDVVFFASGGTAGIRYRILVTIVTSGTQILIGEGIMAVT